MLESGWLPLAADGIVAVLLVVTIVYVARLNGRLTALRADRGMLAEMIAGLQLASKQAEDAVNGLKFSATESGRALGDLIERGGSLRDDLSFLIGRAETIADRLEAAGRVRGEAAAPVRPANAISEPRNAQSRLASLLRQTAAAERAEPSLRTTPALGSSAELEASGQSRQSRSERELQQALQGRR